MAIAELVRDENGQEIRYVYMFMTPQGRIFVFPVTDDAKLLALKSGISTRDSLGIVEKLKKIDREKS